MIEIKDLVKESDNPWHITCSEAPIGILSDKKEELLGWHKCEKDGSPGDLYKENNLDWVLVQFEEDNGFRGLPYVAEWREPICLGKPYWGFQIDELNQIDYYKNLKAVAWMPWEKYEDGNSHAEIPWENYDPGWDFDINRKSAMDGIKDINKLKKYIKQEDSMENCKPNAPKWDYEPEAYILADNIDTDKLEIRLSPVNSFETKIQMTHEQALRLAIKILQCIHSANVGEDIAKCYKL